MSEYTTTSSDTYLDEDYYESGFAGEEDLDSPFRPLTLQEMKDKLAKSRESVAKGKVKDARLVYWELKEKYGL